MSVSLSKIVDGHAAALDDLGNAQTVTCPRCDQLYRLGYSDNEWHRLKDRQRIAETALRRDHAARHKAATIALEWRGIRRR